MVQPPLHIPQAVILISSSAFRCCCLFILFTEVLVLITVTNNMGLGLAVTGWKGPEENTRVVTGGKLQVTSFPLCVTYFHDLHVLRIEP